MNNDLISRSYLKNLPFERVIHTDFGETAIPIEEIDNAQPVEANSIIDGLNNEIDDLSENLAWYINERNRLLKERRPQGKWIVTAEDNDGVHRICCPFCSYEKGSNNTDTIIVTFTNFPKFCENCGAKLKGGADND